MSKRSVLCFISLYSLMVSEASFCLMMLILSMHACQVSPDFPSEVPLLHWIIHTKVLKLLVDRLCFKGHFLSQPCHHAWVVYYRFCRVLSRQALLPKLPFWLKFIDEQTDTNILGFEYVDLSSKNPFLVQSPLMHGDLDRFLRVLTTLNSNLEDFFLWVDFDSSLWIWEVRFLNSALWRIFKQIDYSSGILEESLFV